MDFSSLNWIAILASGIASMVVGFVYYGPIFQNQYLDAAGITMEEARAAPPTNYAIAFVLAILQAVFLSFVLLAMGTADLVGGLVAGAMVWLGFVGTTTGANALFDKTTFRLWALQNGNHLITLMVMGAILAIWR